MEHKKRNTEAIVQQLLKLIYQGDGTIPVKEVSEMFKVSTPALYKQLAKLEKSKVILAKKEGRNKRYSLVSNLEFEKTYPISGLQEDVVLRQDMANMLEGVTETVYSVFSYVFTEMLNNAIEHSESVNVTIYGFRNAYSIRCIIFDQGVGIYSKIQQAMGLEEKRFAILELAKGKFTTDPKSHTGEGVFFSSKVADRFLIYSDSLAFLGDNCIKETTPKLIDNVKWDLQQGTVVSFDVILSRSTTVEDIFKQYTDAPEDYGFSKTIVPVHLLEYREENPVFVSRSQAKRLLVRFERFTNIVLDFTDVREIGQGFADEVFRVFPSQHPDTKIVYTNAVPLVESMIKRAQSVR